MRVLIFMCLLAAGCASAPVQPPQMAEKKATLIIRNTPPVPLATEIKKNAINMETAPAKDAEINQDAADDIDTTKNADGVEGVAVYYAKRFQGRRTNSGAIFDHNKLTAAHPSLPHGTKVRVINLANRKSVVVTVNDRCRKRSFEIIDLSRKAAQTLGFYGSSKAKVKIIPLSGLASN